MSDYTLEENSSVVISTSTIVDDFIDMGGSIRIMPTVPFSMSGNFKFSATGTLDPSGYLYRTFINRVAIECGTNGLFPGFMLYDTYPEHKSVFFPCIVFDFLSEEDVDTHFFGGENMTPLNISCDLVFKKDYVLRDAGVDEYGNSITLFETSLAENLMTKMTDVFQYMVFDSPNILLGEMDIESTVKVPETPKQTLYGFKMDINTEFLLREVAD